MTRFIPANRQPRIARAVGRNGCSVVNATGANAGKLCSLHALPGRDKCFRHLYTYIDVTVSDEEAHDAPATQEESDNDSFIATSATTELSNDFDGSSDATSDGEMLQQMAQDAADHVYADHLADSSYSSLGSGSTISSAPPAATSSISSRLQRLETMAAAFAQEIRELRRVVG